MKKQLLVSLITVLFVVPSLFAAALPKKVKARPRLPSRWVVTMSPGLQSALIMGDLDKVEQIIKENQDAVNVRNKDGSTPLMLAIMNNDQNIVEFLLQQPNIKINEKNNLGKTALDLAQYPPKPNFIKLIKAKGTANSGG
jgi:ankyrin repeat protein